MQQHSIRIVFRTDYPDGGSVVELAYKPPNRRGYETRRLDSEGGPWTYRASAELALDLEELVHSVELQLGIGQGLLDLSTPGYGEEPY